jgi:hypothetical protein
MLMAFVFEYICLETSPLYTVLVYLNKLREQMESKATPKYSFDLDYIMIHRTIFNHATTCDIYEPLIASS